MSVCIPLVAEKYIYSDGVPYAHDKLEKNIELM